MTTALKAEFIKMEITGITVDPFTNAPIVILKGVNDDSVVLPIWIGVLEASAIAAEMEDVRFARPMTHDLVKNIFLGNKAAVSRVEINDLRENVYYATVYMVDRLNASHKLDSRPSDAIAIALRMGAAIFVARDVVDKSKDLEQGKTPGVQQSVNNDPESLLDMLGELSPEAFGKYKM